MKLGMEEGLTAGQREDDRTERREMVDALDEGCERDGRRLVVVFVAISASEIAHPGDDELGEDRRLDVA
jgi:hypothetical protein